MTNPSAQFLWGGDSGIQVLLVSGVNHWLFLLCPWTSQEGRSLVAFKSVGVPFLPVKLSRSPIYKISKIIKKWHLCYSASWILCYGFYLYRSILNLTTILEVGTVLFYQWKNRQRVEVFHRRSGGRRLGWTLLSLLFTSVLAPKIL